MMKRRSKYSTSGRDSDRKRSAEPGAAGPADVRQDAKPPHQTELPTPFAGKPLDGSQYLDVIEEQKYSEQRPEPERRGGRATPDVPD
jgi:hypothetical protein